MNTLIWRQRYTFCEFKWDGDLWYWHRSSQVMNLIYCIRMNVSGVSIFAQQRYLFCLCVHVFLYPFVVNMKNLIAVLTKNMRGSAMIGPKCTKKWCNSAKLGQVVQKRGRWTLANTKISNMRKRLPGNLRIGWLMRGDHTYKLKCIDSAGHLNYSVHAFYKLWLEIVLNLKTNDKQI